MGFGIAGSAALVIFHKSYSNLSIMAEADAVDLVSPNKKLKLEAKPVECTVDSTTNDRNGTSSEMLFSTFQDFEVVRVLNNSEDHKSVAVEGRIAGREGRAVVM